jgi:hypothetical protein
MNTFLNLVCDVVYRMKQANRRILLRNLEELYLLDGFNLSEDGPMNLQDIMDLSKLRVLHYDNSSQFEEADPEPENYACFIEHARNIEDKIDARITWGARGARRRRRTSIKMGSYSVEDRLIRIHPALDRRFVPRYFLEWIVYHEILHQVHDMPIVSGRRQFHTPEFVAQESNYEHYERAREFERRHLDRILNF